MQPREIDHTCFELRLGNWRWLISAGLGFVFGAAAMLMMLHGAAAAPPDTPGSENRLLVRALPSSDAENGSRPAWTPAPLIATAVEMDISGFVIRGTVRQIFQNGSENWVEGIYKFPLPDDAAVDRLTLKVADRIVEGVIEEREAARETYQSAVAAGQAASLLEQERPNLFTVSVANIPPGEAVEVVLGYQAKARRDGDLFELTMPLVAAPRYVPPQPIAGTDHPALRDIERELLRDQAAIDIPVSRDVPRNAAAFVIELRAGAPLESLESPSHDLTVVKEEDGRYRIGLRQGILPANKDFVLRWRTERGQAPGATLFRERVGDADYLLFMMLPPDADTAAALARPRDVTFIIDTSSSMHGEAMAAAKDALAHAVGNLSAKDRFDIVAFNSQTWRLSGSSRPATQAAIDRGLRFTASLQADGGTEMFPALATALSDDPANGAIRQVVFLTDGLVGNENQLFELIERQRGAARLFTVGLGPAPNGWFMRKSAELGRGRNTQITNLDKASETLSQFYDGIAAPVATDLAIGAEGAALESYPRDLPDLYGKEPVIAVMRLANPKGLPVDGFALMGTTEGRMWTRHVRMDAATPGQGIAKLWARAKVESLLDDQRRGKLSEDDARMAVLDVALRHGITTRYTSLVAVDKTPIRPAEEGLVSKDIPADMPEGWTEANLTGPTKNTQADSTPPQKAAAPAVMMHQASLARIGGPAGALGWKGALDIGLIALGAGILLLYAALGWHRREAP